MNTRTSQNKLFDFTIPTLIVGMGGTGLSCARFLEKNNCPFAIADSRREPPQLDEVKKEFTQIRILTGEFDINKFILLDTINKLKIRAIDISYQNFTAYTDFDIMTKKTIRLIQSVLF